MAKKRLFVAINFPEEIKEEIYRWQRRSWDLPVRWTPKENIHLTLQFLGWVDEAYFTELQDALRSVAERHASFAFRLIDITYGPPDGPPRMIWLNGEVSDELRALVENLWRDLAQASFAAELHEEDRAAPMSIGASLAPFGREFRAHITLARFREGERRRKIGRELPEIETEFFREIPVEHIELMESHLAKIGPRYEVVSSFPLGRPSLF